MANENNQYEQDVLKGVNAGGCGGYDHDACPECKSKGKFDYEDIHYVYYKCTNPKCQNVYRVWFKG